MRVVLVKLLNVPIRTALFCSLCLPSSATLFSLSPATPEKNSTMMKRRTAKGSVLDISIRGDEQEQHRIQLEHNLQHTDLSLRLSSASDDEGDEDHHNRNYARQNASSVEYGRHNSAPDPFPEFPSYAAHRSRDLYGDEDTHSQVAAWSYRTGDDEEGINPYGGESVSTAAHHASALTLSAGLGGGRHARRDISISGAEYDPERPLHEMIAGVDSKLSVFDMEPSRSKYPVSVFGY